ncbi:MAG: carbon storage regulator [Gemmatimonadaceae bacterium]|nr:carbon storage regulator [Gemmatimonadaceae bacterium]
MLILSRAEGQSILIDGGIRVVILDADRRGVRVGIEAPAGVRILRSELVADIAEENIRATASLPRHASEGRGLVAPRPAPSGAVASRDER